MKILILSLVALAFCAASHSQLTRYENYRLLNLFLENEEQAKLIRKLEDNEDFDVWNGSNGIRKQVDVLLSPSGFENYIKIFDENNIKYKVVDENIQDKIDEQAISDVIARAQRSNRNDITGIFASYIEINQFMEDFARDNSYITTETIGSSVENRNLNVIKFDTGNTQRKIWLDCGIHARERIAISTCVYIIDYLVKAYNNNNPLVTELLNYYEFTIMPLLNPDGYEYARTSTPLWRKNRRTNVGSSCKGCNLNGNWGFNWNVPPGGGSSNPCSNTYPGPAADSEPETRAVQGYLLRANNQYDAYLTMHTYGLWWFTPWGYTQELPSDYQDILDKIDIGAAAVKASLNGQGSRMTTGSSAHILYVAAGGSEDWAKGFANIKHSTCLELRPGQSGVDSQYGFLLPANRIPLVGEEMTDGVLTYIKALKDDPNCCN